MPSGRLGAADVAGATNTTVYTVPGGVFAVVNVNLCNRNATAVTVRLAAAATGAPSNAEWIEFNAAIPANGVLERTGIVMSATNQLVVFASTTGVSATVFGVET